jgi:hypothetical protein
MESINRNMDYTNDLEIRIFGLRRSGNHAIINWLGAQAPYKPHFFNNVPNSGESPFRTGKNRGEIKGTCLKELWYPHPCYKKVDDDQISKVKDLHKEILMYSYEELDLEVLLKQDYPLHREEMVGKSQKRIDVITLRDFVNWLASKLYIPEDQQYKKDRLSWQGLTASRFEKNRKDLPFFNYYENWEKDAEWIRGLSYISIHKKINMWLGYAREMLGRTIILENMVPVIYNRWVIDEEYRRNIIDKFPGFIFSDKTKDIISGRGGGSTFQTGEQDANKLSIFDRWKYLRNNKIFYDLVKYHVKQMEYNNEIFGEDREISEWLK